MRAPYIVEAINLLPNLQSRSWIYTYPLSERIRKRLKFSFGKVSTLIVTTIHLQCLKKQVLFKATYNCQKRLEFLSSLFMKIHLRGSAKSQLRTFGIVNKSSELKFKTKTYLCTTVQMRCKSLLTYTLLRTV